MEPVNEQVNGYLLDTHVLLWWLFDDPKLSGPARDIIRAPENMIIVSSASGWEIATKSRLGKLPHAGNIIDNLPSLLQKARIKVLSISMAHALAAGALPGPHRDPFDRMLIAQGQIEQIPIVTSDRAFKKYPVNLIW
jgi:PIN domain nuclease of toxin-antitoxin system